MRCDVGMIQRDRVGEVLQEHRLPRARRRDDETALPLPDRDDHVDDPLRERLGPRRGRARVPVLAVRGPGAVGLAGELEIELLLRVERGEVVEEDLVARDLRGLAVDLVDLDEREVPLGLLRRADRALDVVSGSQVEAAYLRRRDVHVVRPGEIVVVGGAEEAEAVGEAFEDAVAVDVSVLGGDVGEDREDRVLLPHPGDPLEGHLFGHAHELGHRLLLQFAQVHSRTPLFDGAHRRAARARRRKRGVRGPVGEVRVREEGREGVAGAHRRPRRMRVRYSRGPGCQARPDARPKVRASEPN